MDAKVLKSLCSDKQEAYVILKLLGLCSVSWAGLLLNGPRLLGKLII